jgi:RNA polymerase sigma factor (sigma-70 family)
MSPVPLNRARTAREQEPERDDPDLMIAVATGDLTALGILYDRYHAATREFLVRAAPYAADADDLVQETFLVLLQAAPSYDGRPRAGGFILGVAAQLLRRRRRFVARLTEILWEAQDLYLVTALTPEETAQTREDLGAVDRALGRMSEAKRLVYLMVECEGLSGEEVATALGVPIGTVWTRLHHARAALQRALLRRAAR